VVGAVTFDYRGFDTLGEEFILFAAAIGTALLLRGTHRRTQRRAPGRTSDALGLLAAPLAGALFVLGIDVVAHGYVTPGGGFQGGVVLAASVVVLFLAVDYHRFAKVDKSAYVEPLEAFGAGAYVALGLISFAFGLAFLENFMELGVFGRLSSGGSAILVNWSSALAVCGGFLVIFGEYLQENMAERHGRRKGR
jgi:multicomponent Na+:H+ antiporter subunit B